jgi:hypothetical protein
MRCLNENVATIRGRNLLASASLKSGRYKCGVCQLLCWSVFIAVFVFDDIERHRWFFRVFALAASATRGVVDSPTYNGRRTAIRVTAQWSAWVKWVVEAQSAGGTVNDNNSEKSCCISLTSGMNW